MNTVARPRYLVYIVDDDEPMRDSLAWLLESRGMEVKTYSSAESFLEGYKPADTISCIVLDVRMPGMSGLELYEELAHHPHPPPVVFITGHGDVPMAVDVLKKGAADFIEKPFNDKEVVELIEKCVQKESALQAERRHEREIQQRLAELTSREREVLELIVAGRLNKQIADDLGISIKTVEVHRARVMEKMAVNSLAELVQRVMAAKKGASAPGR